MKREVHAQRAVHVQHGPIVWLWFVERDDRLLDALVTSVCLSFCLSVFLSVCLSLHTMYNACM